MLAPKPQDQNVEGLIDQTYIDGLERHLGIELTTDIMADGLIALTGRLDSLRELSLNAGAKRHDLAQMAHDIVGTGGQLGLHALTYTARQMERAAITASHKKVQAATSATLDIGARSLEALSHHLKTDIKAEFGLDEE